MNFLGRTISTEWAIPKSEFYENLKREPKSEEVKDESEEKESNDQDKTINLESDAQSPKKIKNKHQTRNALTKTEQRKLQKLKLRKKRSRIVIRNLPFTITEDLIKGHFTKYGNIEEINVLKKPNGSPTGCCFLQFERVQSAAQAIHHENMKPILERPMIVDWAVPKDKFLKSKGETEIKTEIKEEKEENLDDTDSKEKDVNEIKEEEEDEEKEEISAEENSDDEDEEGEDSEENDDDDEDDEDKKNIKVEFDNESVSEGPRRISNDVSEGKTVFIKNVPFSATNDDLKYCMEQFGPVYYALICMDRLTEHSKGTAFVKFRVIHFTLIPHIYKLF